MVDILCGPLEKRRFYLDLAYEDENEEEPCRYAMMRTGMEERESATASLMESLYTCFTDFRKLSREEKALYIAKERDRCARQVQYSMVCDTENVELLDKVTLAMRDVYASLHRRLEVSEEVDPQNKELDVLLADLLTSTPLAAARIWLQGIPLSTMETKVILPWMTDSESKSGEAFVKLVMQEIRPRIERWIKKHNLPLSEQDQQTLLDHLTRFSEMFYQCSCQWVVKYLRALVRGDMEEMDHAAENPIFFMNMITAYVPFDVIVLDSATLDVFYDSHDHMVGDAPRDNTVCLLYFKKDKRFESVGIVCPPLDKDQPSRLTRLIPVQHQMVLDLRNSVDKDDNDDEKDEENHEDDEKEEEDDKKEEEENQEDEEDNLDDNEEDEEDNLDEEDYTI